MKDKQNKNGTITSISPSKYSPIFRSTLFIVLFQLSLIIKFLLLAGALG